ncbi:putative acriflavine sensitivity control protein acr-2 [Podospora australis]|uniref:Acriflavine sensitivity control protein acr-2 n=1 Tax=Podospora australis TaxID=1536484 RepID=A0AAN6WPC6_9PEZI|nr:putative acriflavine sensitivity control protein acr-2 [Podospora australis]
MPGPKSQTLVATGASAQQSNLSKPCHNCRRRRLRCDRSRPFCHKCSVNGEECLGYGTVLRWANAPAVRGRLAPQNHPFPTAMPTPSSTTSTCSSSSSSTPRSLDSLRSSPSAETVISSDSDAASPPSDSDRSPVITTVATVKRDHARESYFLPPPTLIDPMLKGLNSRSRYYIHHFSFAVCRDMVSLDQLERNPFRAMIPLTGRFDYLQSIVVATGAMHLATLHGYQGRPNGPELVDALQAKDKAIRLLKQAMTPGTGSKPPNPAMILAAIVFFVNLDLIDSGKGSWQAHIQAASSLMASLQKRTANMVDESLMHLVDAIAADCLTYRIFGATISGVDTDWAASGTIDLYTVLKRAEAHSYHCCPPRILEMIMDTSVLYSDKQAPLQEKIHRAYSILHRARTFDVYEWVYSIQGLSPQDDLPVRVSLASAHRAAACLYVLLCVPEASAASEYSVQFLVQEVTRHLAEVPIDHVLLKGIVWPTFMAAAQTDDLLQREWYLDRLQAVWAKNPWICPWGYIRTAIEMLKEIWLARDAYTGPGEFNWLSALKSKREQALIV